MSAVRLSENEKFPSSWYQSNWRAKNEDYKKYDDGWGWAEGQSGRVPESSHNGAKRTKIRGEHLKVSADDLWKVRAKLDGKKSSLSRT